MEVLIDGVRYVRADQQPNDAAMKVLGEVYGRLWCEAYYEPTNASMKAFAQPLADLMAKANEALKFKA